MTQRRLIPLGGGAYTVPEVCRILRPGMTPRKVHYWLDTQLLSRPIAWGGPGRPTLLNYRQLLQIRTVQYLRDELRFSLPKVREAFEFILIHLFAEEWADLKFVRGPNRELIVVTADGQAMTVPGGQGILTETLPELNLHVAATRRAWEQQAFVIPNFEHIVSNPRVQVGSPTIRGTRVETAMLAAFGHEGRYTAETLRELVALHPTIAPQAIEQALEFEGLARAS